MSGLVAAAALLGCAGPAFAGTGATGRAGLPEARPQVSGSGFFSEGTSISCASPTACLAIGDSSGPAGTTPIAARLHAGTWKPVPVKTPKGAPFTLLHGVSCKSATFCLVVGDATRAGTTGYSPYALTWNGTTLTPTTAPPVPKGDVMGTVTSVSCVAVKSCVAIGFGGNGTGVPTTTFVWTFNGTRWALTTLPAVGTGTAKQFDGLHCFSLTSCVVIGDSFTVTDPYGTQTPVVGGWNGKTFTDLKAPLPSGTRFAEFTGLSCASPHSCAVVGNDDPASGGSLSLGFAEVWNGKTWTLTKWAGPKGDIEAQLLGVSCTSAVRCIAVGDHGTNNVNSPGALAWNGAKWTALKVAGPGTGKTATFEGISCPINAQCVTTGQIGKWSPVAPQITPLAGYWNGRVWKYGPM
jgi:hypothetical protein